MTIAPRTPEPEGLNLEFYEHAASGTLHLQRCLQCGRHRHAPRYLCPHCFSDRYEWSPSAGRGELFSWTVTHFPYDRGWSDELPYRTLVVELEEGVRMIGADGLPAGTALQIGRPLVAQIDTATYGFAFVTFAAPR